MYLGIGKYYALKVHQQRFSFIFQHNCSVFVVFVHLSIAVGDSSAWILPYPAGVIHVKFIITSTSTVHIQLYVGRSLAGCCGGGMVWVVPSVLVQEFDLSLKLERFRLAYKRGAKADVKLSI